MLNISVSSKSEIRNAAMLVFKGNYLVNILNRENEDNINFTVAFRPALRPICRPIQRVPGALSPGIKRPGREADR
jgi:hypothetical protein